MTPPRAAVVVTGSELIRGDRTDLNGPFLAQELAGLGIEPGRVTIVGDRPEELEAALRESLDSDLCVVSGGLGPTHDDRTVEALARVTGRELGIDERLAAEIEGVSRRIAERLQRPYAEFEAGVRKQASLPGGARSLGLAGTAPGIVLATEQTVFVVLPGPPAELRRLWMAAVEAEPVRRVLARAETRERRVLRFFGTSESSVAEALADAGGGGERVEATICARNFEIWVELFGDARRLADALRDRLAPYLFAEDARPAEELVLDLCRERGLTLATAESCTGGLVATRLTSVPGASDVFRGGIVAYDDEVKIRELEVPPELLERHGAVSRETAGAMATGARMRLAAEVAVSVTGIAGPGGGTPEKPVGRVHLCADAGGEPLTADLDLPGDRDAIRGRAAAAALHLVRRLLAQSRDERV